MYDLRAEQSIIGSLLRDNDAVDNLGNLRAEHFYSPEHAMIFREVTTQITAGMRADVVTVGSAMQGRLADAMKYLNQMVQDTPSAARISRYVDIVLEKAIKRGLYLISGELAEWVTSHEAAQDVADRAAARIEALAQVQTMSEPTLIADLLTGHAEMLVARQEGIIRPVSTGFADVDVLLGGGLERGTLTVVAGRPAMGKTAFGLALARNAADNGDVALFLSMEMPKHQVMDRNISALARVPLTWMKEPTNNEETWRNITHAYARAKDMPLYIDDQPGMNMLQLRAKARQVRRRAGKLGCLVIDQLSFLQGAESENMAYALGEYTRALVAVSKELDCAVVLLAQLNRKCEDRPNKRPMLSDLASSGAIEQDAATAIFLYRDEVYNPNSEDIGICEIIVGKARQGSTGMRGLTYIGEQTRFEDMARGTKIRALEAPKRKNLAESL